MASPRGMHQVWEHVGARMNVMQIKPYLGNEDSLQLSSASLLRSILTPRTSFAPPKAPLKYAGQLLSTLSYR